MKNTDELTTLRTQVEELRKALEYLLDNNTVEAVIRGRRALSNTGGGE